MAAEQLACVVRGGARRCPPACRSRRCGPGCITCTSCGDHPHHGEVVADEQVAEAELGLQLGQQLEDLRLHEHVERATPPRRAPPARATGRGRGRSRRAGAGRRRARAGSRSASDRGRATWSSSSSTRSRRAAAVPTPCTRSGSATELLDRVARVERGVRVLEHRLHAAAEARTARPGAIAVDVAAVEAHRPDVGRLQAEHDVGGGRLARTRLADERRRSARRGIWNDAVDGGGRRGSRAGGRGGERLHAGHARPRGPRRAPSAALGADRQRGAAATRGSGSGAQQCLGVLVLRGVEDLRRRAGLDDCAAVHHGDRGRRARRRGRGRG